MKRAAALLLSAAALAATAGWVVVRPARYGRAAASSDEPDAPVTAVAGPTAGALVKDAPRPRQASAPEDGSGAAYFAQVDAAKRSFAAEPRDVARAAHAEAELRAAVQDNLSERAARLGLADDLQVEKRRYALYLRLAPSNSPARAAR